MYADDIGVLAEFPEEVQMMLGIMGQYTVEWKLSFKVAKTMHGCGGEKWQLKMEDQWV